MARMLPDVENQGDAGYREVLAEMAGRAREWEGPVVVLTHVDPDGDAVGSALALARALRGLGKRVSAPVTPPSFLAFLAEPGELCAPLPELEPGTLLIVLDTGEAGRAHGAPLTGAAALFNVDHHGTNPRFGDLAVVEPGKAATAVLVKEFIDLLGVAWTPAIATPCLAGILTDTGNFRHGNTNREALSVAGELLDHGVRYSDLTDRLQWRPRSYFMVLARVMGTVRFEFDGRLVFAQLTDEMRAGAEDDDSEDFVGLIRYAEGALVAVLLKERQGAVKLSVRTRGGVSAQRICLALGGGGHVAAAGATVIGSMAEAEAMMLAAVREELARPPAERP